MIRWTIRTKMILLLIPAIIAVLAVSTVLSLQLSSATAKQEAYDATLNSARAYADEFNTELSGYLTTSQTFATVLSQPSGMTREEVMAVQHRLLEENPRVVGVGVIFEPNTFDGQDARYANTPGHDATGRFATYWNRLNGTENLRPVVDIETSDWYTVPRQTGAPFVMAPGVYENVLMTSFIQPIVRNRSFTGTVGMDVSLASIDQAVSRVKVFDTGYAFLVSNNGVFVSCPTKTFIGNVSLDGLAREQNDPDLAKLASEISAGREGYIETVDPFTGRPSVLFYSPILTGNWSMVMVAPSAEILAGVSELGRILLLIGFIAILVTGGIVVLVARNLSGPIVAMSLTADRIAAGDLDVRVPDEDGELGVLARAFNNMAARLRETIGSLEGKIAELRATQQALQESEAKYRSLFDSMMDAFASVDMDGRIRETNTAFNAMLGYTTEELRRLTYRELTPEKWHAREAEILQEQVLVRGYSDVYEKEYIRKDTTIFPVEVRTFLMKDRDGNTAGMWAIVRDISGRKHAEEEIRLASAKLALMTDVTYQDIQNKVTALLGYVSISQSCESEEKRLEIIRKEEGILTSINDLIRDTKEYQQMGAGQLRWVDVKKAILVQAAIMERAPGIALAIDLRGLEIFADPLIERVFYNIISNAEMHGKTVTRIAFTCRETPEYLVLICEDNGVGIPRDEKPRIFDRVAGENRFGLFFVREFLTLSGMSVEETGEPGSGARFEIRVPRGSYRFAGGSAEEKGETGSP